MEDQTVTHVKTFYKANAKDQMDRNADSGTPKSVTHGETKGHATTGNIVHLNMTTTIQQENSLKQEEPDHAKEIKNSKGGQKEKTRAEPNMPNQHMHRKVPEQDTPHLKHLKMKEENRTAHHQQEQQNERAETVNRVHHRLDQHDMRSE